jgi:hypothetical protein
MPDITEIIRLTKIHGKIPASGTAIDANIDETHRLFQSAIKEYLEYWKDQNPAHISSGQLTLKRSVGLMNKTVAAATAKMKEFSPK